MKTTLRPPRLCTFLYPVSTLMLALTSQVMGQSYSVTPITVPGATALSVNALNQAGQVAGDYYVGSPVPRAFRWSGGTAADLGTLGGSSSRVFGLNNFGDVAGQSSTAGDVEAHAFLFTSGVIVDLQTLGASPSVGSVLNDVQQVAGYSYLVPGSLEAHSFIVETLGGSMMDLGTLGGMSSSPAGINLMGQVVGSSSTAGDAETHAYLSMGGMMLDLGTLGGTFSFATSINLFGQLTGGATTAGDAELHAFVLDSFTFSGMVDLGTLGGTFSQGYAINQAGQVIGDSTTAGDADTHAFLHTGGVMVDLGSLGGYSTAYGLNDAGQVVGVSALAGGAEHAFVWQNGGMVDLNSLLPGGSGWVLQAAYYINNAGQIVGAGTWNGDPAWFMLNPQTYENQPPVASAGADQVFPCVTNSVLVSVDASASTDPDNDALTFEWREDSTILGAAAQLQVSLPHGEHTLIVRVTDSHGASAEDSVVVTVGDTVAPTFPCPAGQTAEANANGKGKVPNFLRDLVASDNCTRAGALLRSQNPPAGTALPCGTYAVTVSVKDAAGNVGSCSVPFVVVDVTAPRVPCPETSTKRAGTNGLAAVPDYRDRPTDNCTPANELVVVQTPAPGTLVGLGQHSIILTATDAAGNSGSCTSVMTVVDLTDPSFLSLTASPESLVAGSGAMVPVVLTAVATDNCDAHPVFQIVSVTSSDPVTGGADTTSPDWNITGNLTLELRAERSEPTRTRTYAVKVSCTDASGNSSMRTVHVTVKKAPK